MEYPISNTFMQAIKNARQVASKYDADCIGTEQILYGILSVDCVASKLLKEAGLKLDSLDELLKVHATQTQQAFNIISQLIGVDTNNGELELTDKVKHLIIAAHNISSSTGGLVSPEAFILEILKEPSSVAYQIVNIFIKSPKSLIKKLEEYLRVDDRTINKAGGFFEDIDDDTDLFHNKNSKTVEGSLPSVLLELGQDLTKKARENKIDPIIGRESEIERIIQILCRKTKNNPVLIGEPGVGKSAVVEGLAKAIIEGRVPESLQNKIIFSLDLGSLMAGTKYRGTLEEKLKEAINVIKTQENIIIFIDEIHTLAQAGSEKGEVSPADMLKPYLSRGELQTIGATTLDEYRKHIEADKALERRFQPIIVEPPSIDDTIAILRGLRNSYEAYHKVGLSDQAIVAAVKLSDRYIMDRFLPDKAIDLIDEAMSMRKVAGDTLPQSLKDNSLKIEELRVKKQEAVEKENYEQARDFKKQIDELIQQDNKSKVDWSKKIEKSNIEINEDDIATVVAKWTKIPITKINKTEQEKLVNLESVLQQRVIGQQKAIESVSKAIRRARAGLKDPNRPIGSFMFVGPTGVGKTELTKAISATMFDNENNIIRLDMSEYMESHSVSKLIGSPPGYVGHDDGGQLTEQVRRKPYSVVLFDEVEKAHPDIYNSLLQIMDEGRLTDSQGRVVSFKNTVVIMTSNVGVDELKNTPRTLGFSAIQMGVDKNKTDEILNKAIKNRFKPEFLNRVDGIIVFEHLTKQDLKQITILMLEKVVKKLAEQNISLKYTQQAIDYLVLKGYDQEYGARPLRRLIEQTVEDNIAEMVLQGSIKPNTTITLDIDVMGKVSFG